MANEIHPTAIIAKEATIGSNVKVGPYVVIEGPVVISDNVEIGPFVHIKGNTFIGENTKIFTGAALGNPPQDMKFKGEDTNLIIGKDNTIREYVMINPGTSATGKTVIGDGNLFMAYVHVAHDCIVGNNCIIANVGTLAGHVEIGDKVVIGGLTGVHQFTRIGSFAIIGGCSKVVQDVPPFAMADGHPAKIYGINTIGIKRAGIAQSDRSVIKKAFDTLFFSGHSLSKAQESLTKEISDNKYVQQIIDFISSSGRGICRSAKESD